MLSYDKMMFFLDSLDSAANLIVPCPSDLEKHQTKNDYARCLDGHIYK